jgi:RNA polymerase sigma-70 factor (ECF subfamily)
MPGGATSSRCALRPSTVCLAPAGPVQTTAFEIDGDVIRALYVVRNPDKLRHLAVR